MTQQEQITKSDAPLVKADFDALAEVKVVGEIDLLTLAKAYAASGMFADVKTQSQAIVKISAGYEIGIPPFASMTGFHCIPRKRKDGDKWVETVEISMSANLRAAVIQRDPNIDLKVIEQTKDACEVEVAVRFAGQWEKRGSVRYTLEEAKAVMVNVGGGNKRPLADGDMWKNFPADMLFAAVMRRISKRYAAHLFIGELGRDKGEDEDLVDAAVEVEAAHAASDVVEGEVVTEPDAERPVPARASTEGEEGATAEGETDAPARDGQAGAEAPASLFVDDEPPLSEPPAGEDVPADEPVHVGLVPVFPAPGEHESAFDRKDRVAPARITAARELLKPLNLIDTALEAIFKARYNFAAADATTPTFDEFEAWLGGVAAHVASGQTIDVAWMRANNDPRVEATRS